MAAIVRIDTRSNTAKILLNYLKSLPFVKVEEQIEKSPYNPEFVKKIKKAEKQKGRVIESGQSLWESL